MYSRVIKIDTAARNQYEEPMKKFSVVLKAKEDNTIVKGGPGAPITCSLVGPSSGTRASLELLLSGGDLGSREVIHFDLMKHCVPLGFVGHNGSARSGAWFEIVAQGGLNIEKVAKRPVRNARLTIVAQGGGNKVSTRDIIVKSDANLPPIVFTVIGINGGNRTADKGAFQLVISGGDLGSGEAVQFDLTATPIKLKLITPNGSNRSSSQITVVAQGGGNKSKSRAPKRDANTRFTLSATASP
ncbi:MAG TPA: hypothetical protein VFQ78_15880 [Candidatus Udaeobacter sp.]|nr:hypothetical protein [Candidatus Udaeobacter sp.]